ncbi:MAG: hypothetical protein JF606_18535 [Burkholderiales bacterium]|jgi:hypothetical protein|nr:hypothetical protein [Burkholderiales bacterium]
MQFSCWNSTTRFTGSDLRRALLVSAAVLLPACIGVTMVSAGSPAGDSDKTKLEVRVDGMHPGEIKTFAFEGRRFVIVRTTDDMLDDLRDQTRNTWSRRPIPSDRTEFLVFAMTAAPTGCTVLHAPKGLPRYAPDRVWQGGFYDSCQFGEWDYAGRSIKQYEDQDETIRRPDLEVPTFEIKGQTTLRIVR